MTRDQDHARPHDHVMVMMPVMDDDYVRLCARRRDSGSRDEE
ncbi:MAG TPA: hypothetical protein VHY22_03435 [Chthoniobacteraceae bacterium]|nr:hypothetical protein [Chthoniobacteraceae bacterium]